MSTRNIYFVLITIEYLYMQPMYLYESERSTKKNCTIYAIRWLHIYVVYVEKRQKETELMRVGGERGCCLKVVGGRADPRQMLQSGLSVVELLAGMCWWVGGA